MIELILSPFVYRHGGASSKFLIRENEAHVDRVRRVIGRREHPAWSRFAEEVRAA